MSRYTRYYELKEAGKCPNCAKAHSDGTVHCNTCKETKRTRHNDLYSSSDDYRTAKKKWAMQTYRNKSPEKRILNFIRSRAKAEGLEFDLSLVDIEIPTICPVLGIPIVLPNGQRRSDGTASVDRIDNTKGYIKSNIKIISWRTNRLKNDASLDELKLIFEYVASHTQDLNE